MTALLCYTAGISAVSVLVTVYDKRAAKRRPAHRVPEHTLLWLAALGGSVAMYLTMRLIRHKTRHRRFMIGLPAMIVVQALAVGGLWLWFNPSGKDRLTTFFSAVK